MQTTELSVQKRDKTGKGVARKLRAEGLLPAVVYGNKVEPTSLIVNERAVDRILRTKLGMNTLIELKIEGGDTHKALIKDVHGNPINRRLKHIDFYVVDENQEVAISIPAKFTGKAAGLAQGGVMDVKKHEIDLIAKVGLIPEEIVIDVTELNVGENIHLEDLTLPSGVRAREGYNPTIVAMISIVAEPEPVAVEAAEGEGEAAADGDAAPAEGDAKPAEGEGEKKE